MKEYMAYYKNSTVDWNKVDILEMNVPYFNEYPAIKAYAQVAYNDESIFIRLITKEKNFIALEKGPLGNPCQDSCLEFFFCPCEYDKRYFNVEFNSNGCMFLGIGSGINDLTRLIPFEGQEVLFSPKIKLHPDGWEINYKIDYKFIKRFFPDFEISKCSTMRANFYKCSEKGSCPHFLSWNKVSSNPFTFHTQTDFGLIRLEKSFVD